jgi:hypothetical protein
LRKKRKRSNRPLLLILVGLILMVTAALVVVFSTGGPGAAALSTPTLAGPDADIPRVSAAEALAGHQSGEAVIVDVRDSVYYELGHISGAISIPLNELPARLGELDPEDWIITY